MAKTQAKRPRKRAGNSGLRVLSWNVNGLRAIAGKGFDGWLEDGGGDIVGIQEIRAFPEQLPDHLQAPARWQAHFAPAERPGYSGVGMFSRLAPTKVERAIGVERFDVEGRLQLARFGKLVVVNAYFPNGNGTDRDNSRVPYKLDFYRAVFDVVQRRRRAGYRVLVMGDFNTAHQDIDLARPRENKKTSGFLPEEREELDRWLQAGWIDTFRRQQPEPGHHAERGQPAAQAQGLAQQQPAQQHGEQHGSLACRRHQGHGRLRHGPQRDAVARQ